MYSKIEKRRDEIYREVIEKGRVLVKEQASKYNTSLETIRRDLAELAREKKLKKIHGGAVSYPKYEVATYYEERLSLNSNKKEKIARRAAGFIKDGDVVAFEYGSTVFKMIKYILDKKGITIVTNSVLLLNEILKLREQKKFFCKFIFLGGELGENPMSITGKITEDTLKNLRIDKAFISGDGISMDWGLSTKLEVDASLAKLYIKNSTDSYVLIDSTKFSKEYLYKIVDFEDIGNIVTDENIPERWKNAEKEIDVYTARGEENVKH